MTSTENAVGMETPLGAGMHKESSAVEAIGRLEELARAANDLVPYTGDVWFSEQDLTRSGSAGMDRADAAFIAAVSPAVFLSLIESLRHSVEREAGLREALTELVGVCEGNIYPQPDKPESSWAKLQRARAALDRRAAT